MAERDTRRAAIAAYKRRKAPCGVFAVRCAVSGECWVGSNLVLDKIRNRIWFMLRQGGSPHPTLQEAWDRHGAEAFVFEVLEEMSGDGAGLSRDRMLAERAAHWCRELGAQPI